MKFLLKAFLICLACALVPLGLAAVPTRWGLPTSLLTSLSIGLAFVAAFTAAAWLNRERRQLGRHSPTTSDSETASLRVLADTASALNSSLEFTTVLNEVLDAIIRLTGAERGLLMLKDEAGELRFCAARNEDRTPLDSSAFPISQTVVQQVAEQGRPVVTTDAQADPRFARSGSAVRFHLRSIMCVPLKAKGAVIGVIYLDNRTRPGLFSERELDLLTAFANQAASAIENARLFQSMQHQLNQLSLLNEIALASISAANFDEAVTQALQVLQHRLGYDIVGLDLIDDAGEWLHVHPSYIGAGDTPLPPPLRVGEGIVGAAMQSGHAVRVDDVRRDPRYVPVLAEVRSELAVPLKLTDRVMGVINTESRRLAAYTETDEQLLTVVAGVLAPIIENARLRARAEQHALENAEHYHAAQRRAEQMRLVNEVGRDIAGILEVDTLLAQVSQRLETAFGYYHAKVGLIEGEEVVFRARFDEPRQMHLPEIRLRVDGPGIIAWAARHSAPRLTSDTRADPYFLANPLFPNTRSEAAVPLLAHSQTIGVLDAQSERLEGLGSEDLAALQAISGQLAVAVENARLFAEVRQRASEVSALLATTLAVISSLELGKRLETIAQHALPLVEADSCTIYKLDHDGRHLRPIVALDEHYAQEVLADMTLVGQGIIGYVAQTGVGELVKRTDLDPRALQIPGTSEAPESLIAVPLRVGNRITGVMALYREGLREFKPHDLELITSFAAQAAVVIENAELYQALVERADSLQAAYNQLTDLDRLKDELVQNVSHELRTPLTFLHSYVDLLLGGHFGPLQPEQEKSLRIVADKTNILTHLVSDIITLQAVTPESLKLVSLDLMALARAAADGVAAVAQQAGVRLTINLPETPMLVQGDPLRLAQVFDNLLGNALKYIERDGEIHLSVQPGRDMVRVEIRDTGIGISPENVERIFDRFYQVVGARTRRRGGLGLGLAICKLIVEAHNGYMGVESQVGQGSCFYFTLPVLGVLERTSVSKAEASAELSKSG